MKSTVPSTSSAARSLGPPSAEVDKPPSDGDDAPLTEAQIAAIYEAFEQVEATKKPEIIDDSNEPLPVALIAGEYEAMERDLHERLAHIGRAKKRLEMVEGLGDTSSSHAQIAAGHGAKGNHSAASLRLQEQGSSPSSFSPVAQCLSVHHESPAAADEPAAAASGNLSIAVDPPHHDVESDIRTDAEPNETSPNIASVPVLEARLVPDEPTIPIYDALPIPTTQNHQPWSKRNQRNMFVGALLLAIGAMAAVLAMAISSQNDNRGDQSNKLTDPQGTNTGATIYYYADRENIRCQNDLSGETSTHLPQRLFESLEECCEAEFLHLDGDECLRNSLGITSTSTKATVTTLDLSSWTNTEWKTNTTTATTTDSTSTTTTSTDPVTLFSGIHPPTFVWEQNGQAIAGESALDKSGYSVSLSDDGNIVAIGSPGDWNNTDRPGYVKVFQENDSSSWLQLGQTIRGVAKGDLLGTSVDLSADGRILAVGASGHWPRADRPGYARIYRREGFGSASSWKQLGQTINGEANGDQAGEYVALSADGSIVAIGASENDDNDSASGSVRVFQMFDGASSWLQLGQTIYGEKAYDHSGKTVDLTADGKTVAIGAPSGDGNGEKSGSVRIFHIEEGVGQSWRQVGQVINGKAAGDESGDTGSVALSADGRTVAIGGYYNSWNGKKAGHARVFRLETDTTGASWRQLGQDLYGEAAGDQFGISVALSDEGNILAVGANGNDSNGDMSGQVKTYFLGSDGSEAGLIWKQVGQDITGQRAGDNAGCSVSLSANGKAVAVGSVWNDDNGEKSGHVRVFQGRAV